MSMKYPAQIDHTQRGRIHLGVDVHGKVPREATLTQQVLCGGVTTRDRRNHEQSAGYGGAVARGGDSTR